MVSLNAAMNVDSSGASRGTATNPYTIEMFQVLTIPMTATTYNGPNTDPWNTANFDRCSVTTTLHYNTVDRIAVDASTPLYQFDSQSQATSLKIHWRSQDGTFQDYFVIQTKVIYTRTSEVIVLDEGFVYVTITNPCTVSGVINSQTISDISYTIKDSQSTRTVSLYTDSPSVRDGSKGTGHGYLHTNAADVCGAKSYAIVMADKSANTNTAYHDLGSVSGNIPIQTYTTDPVYVTNANVQYYLRVTFNDYYTTYPATARDDGYNLNMVSCVLTSGGSAFPTKAADKVDTYMLYTPVRKYDYDLWTTACDTFNSQTYNYKNNLVYTVKIRTWYDDELDISDFSDGTRTPFVVWDTGYSGTPASPSG